MDIDDDLGKESFFDKDEVPTFKFSKHTIDEEVEEKEKEDLEIKLKNTIIPVINDNDYNYVETENIPSIYFTTKPVKKFPRNKKDENTNIYWDSKYDGEYLIFYDYEGSEMFKVLSSIYVGSIDKINSLGLKNNNLRLLICENKHFAIVNPSDQWKKDLKREKLYDWHLLNCITDDLDLKINTVWNPIYVEKLEECDQYESCDQHKLDKNTIFICESSDVDNFQDYYFNFILVPLIDTLQHLFQKYYNCTLLQIAMIAYGKFNTKFHDKKYLMNYLFDLHKDEIMDVCSKEKISIHRIYTSNFNIYFNHTGSGFAFKNEILNITTLVNVIARPLSLECNQKTYGNIPWLIKDKRNNKLIENGPIGYQPIQNIIADIEGENYLKITIFPKREYNGKRFNSYYIGLMKTRQADSIDFVIRGEIFEGISVLEELILREMYSLFHKELLTMQMDFTKTLRYIPFQEDQLKLRKDFIRMIQSDLVDNSNSR